jgi:hypothetical protein
MNESSSSIREEMCEMMKSEKMKEKKDRLGYVGIRDS